VPNPRGDEFATVNLTAGHGLATIWRWPWKHESTAANSQGYKQPLGENKVVRLVQPEFDGCAWPVKSDVCRPTFSPVFG